MNCNGCGTEYGDRLTDCQCGGTTWTRQNMQAVLVAKDARIEWFNDNSDRKDERIGELIDKCAELKWSKEHYQLEAQSLNAMLHLSIDERDALKQKLAQYEQPISKSQMRRLDIVLADEVKNLKQKLEGAKGALEYFASKYHPSTEVQVRSAKALAEICDASASKKTDRDSDAPIILKPDEQKPGAIESVQKISTERCLSK
jgi:hypothetical protein